MIGLDGVCLTGESFFRSVVDSSIDCMKVLDLEGRIRFMNRAGAALMEIAAPDAVQGVAWTTFWPEEQQPAVLRALEEARTGRTSRFVAPCPTAAGTAKVWDNVVAPLHDEGGALVGLLCTSRDVTETFASRAAAESRELTLKRQTIALRSAGRAARVGGWDIDWRRRVVVFSEEMWELLGGAPGPELSLNEALQLWGAEDRDRFVDHLERAAASGERIAFEGKLAPAGGRDVWLRIVAEPELAEGQCVAIRGAAQDITEERGGRLRLEQSEAFARGIIDGMAATLCVLDEAGVVVSANQAWRDFALTNGLGEGLDAVGADYLELCRRGESGAPARVARGLRQVLEGAQSAFQQEYPCHTSAEKRWFKLHAYRLPGDGPIRVVVMHQPITELKLSEQRLRRANRVLKAATQAAKAASEAKSIFLATMSHEIRTPLNGVLGMAQAMAADQLPPVQRDRLEVIQRSGEALLVLLNDLLDLSKVEAGKLELEDGVIDVDEIAIGAQAAFTTLAAGKDVYFSLEVAPAAAGCWRGDPTRVRQVLYNLVANAVKFTDRGSVQVQIVHSDGLLAMRVADTGPGVAPERQARLFDKFVQEDAATTRRYGGSGLGLAICQEFVSLMGGRITLDSVVGQGSTFTVLLPLERAERPAPAGPVAAPVAPAAGLRILAAEDNPMNQLVLKTLLAQVGVEPWLVEDGEQAVAAWEQGEFDLILMDVQMPVLDGPAAARRIRERERVLGRARTPIIAVTANAMSHHAAEYAQAGMDAVASKPIRFAELLDCIDRVLTPDPLSLREREGPARSAGG